MPFPVKPFDNYSCDKCEYFYTETDNPIMSSVFFQWATWHVMKLEQKTHGNVLSSLHHIFLLHCYYRVHITQ